MKSPLRHPSIIFFIALQSFVLLGILSALLASRVNSDSILQGNTIIRGHTEEILSLVVNNTRNHTKVLLEPAENSVLLSHALLQDKQINSTDDKALEHYFLKQLQTHQHFSGMYLGRPDGTFLFVRREVKTSEVRTPETSTTQSSSQQISGNYEYRTKAITLNPQRTVSYLYHNAQGKDQYSEIDPIDNYDPRTRSWYKSANQKLQTEQYNKAIWTKPYIFFDSQQPGITTAKTIIDNHGNNLGTVGIDIELADLSHYLETITLKENKSFPFIKTADNIVLAFPNFASYLDNQTTTTLPTIDDLGDTISQGFLKNATTTVDGIIDFKFQNADYIGTLQPITILDQQQWNLGIYAPKEVYTGNIQNQYRQNLLRILIIGFLLSCVAIPISLSIARPLSNLQERATTDTLTGLLNRGEFLRQAELKKAEAERLGIKVAYLMLDLDTFKPINDTFGHATGDEVLVIVAKRLKESIKQQDILGRYGGDEFCMCLFDITPHELQEIVERIRQTIETPKVFTSKDAHKIGATVGAVLSHEAVSQTILIGLADKALIQGKTMAKGKSYIANASLDIPNSKTSTQKSQNRGSINPI